MTVDQAVESLGLPDTSNEVNRWVAGFVLTVQCATHVCPSCPHVFQTDYNADYAGKFQHVHTAQQPASFCRICCPPMASHQHAVCCPAVPALEVSQHHAHLR